tara:strand:- start:18201 stop:19319 length:1119 start_codon:yes stop_codon:yes gene_type:complete
VRQTFALRHRFAGLALGLIAGLASAASAGAAAAGAAPEADYAKRPQARAMIDSLGAKGLDKARLRELLNDAKRQDAILTAIARPAERTLDWARYQKIFLQESRVQKGVAFARQHRDALDRAERQYGVPREIILAIIGVETLYGQHKGQYRVLDALATLGFDYPPRGEFFRKQLMALFELEREAHIDASEITGSYAGAMGYPQFIPTSYQAYAVDFDGDDVIDLVNSPADAIGSVAHYFHEHRWQPGLPVAARARINGNGYQALAKKGYKPSFTLDDARKNGVVAVSCDSDTLGSQYCFDLAANTPVALLDLTGTDGHEFWLITDNFYVITRYNHSELYAMAVLQLSKRLAEALAASPPPPAPATDATRGVAR